MAYIDLTALNAYQTRSKVQTEMKEPISGVIPFAKDQTNYFPNLTTELVSQIQNANGRDIDMSAITEATPTVANAFSFDIDVNISATAKTRLTIYNFWTGFHFYKYDFANNAVAAMEYKMNKYAECDKALQAAVSTQLLSIIDGRKTQTFATTGAPSGFAFNGTPDAIEIALALHDDPFFSYLNATMRKNELGGTYSYVTEDGIDYIIADHKQYAAYNNKDLMNQSFPKIYREGGIDVTSGSRNTGYYVKDGALALVESFPIEFLDNASTGNSKWGIGDMELPLTQLKPLLYESDYEADTSSLTASDRPTQAMTVGTKYGMGVSFAVPYSYNSDLTSRVNDIAKVELLST